MMDPQKGLRMCTAPREYRQTTREDIETSKEDKRRGGGPRVGPFQETIPGSKWAALPKYDFTSRNRSSCFNERMHVEWENHADHILANGGELPTASVVAKAGFRSCAPCCRDMLALARPTGKTFIMVDLAEDDSRGTFHFVTGDKYLPVPKEACTDAEVKSLKRLVLDAQEGKYTSSQDIYHNVLALGTPIDQAAQHFYLADKALLPAGCAKSLRGQALLDVLHAEHFARLPAEYGASILRDAERPEREKDAIRRCRALAKQALIAAWRPHLQAGGGRSGELVDLDAYAEAAVAPLLPEEPARYARARRALQQRPVIASGLTVGRLQLIEASTGQQSQGPSQAAAAAVAGAKPKGHGRWTRPTPPEDDLASTTAPPDDDVDASSATDDD